MKYNLILLDADGTLFDYDKAELYSLKNAFKEYKVKGIPIKILSKDYREINNQIWKNFENNEIDLEALRFERFKRLFDMHNLKIDCYKFSETYLKYLTMAGFVLKNTKKILKYLEKININKAIITNGLKIIQRSRINKSILSNYIKNIIISEEIGVGKPEKGIFEYSLKKMNQKDKSKVIIVGDSLTSDILGGINFGIDTCWFNPNGLINDTDLIPTYEIRNILELKKIIK